MFCRRSASLETLVSHKRAHYDMVPDATHVGVLFDERVADRISMSVTGSSNGPLS